MLNSLLHVFLGGGGGLTGWNGDWDADPWDAVLGSATVYGYETSRTPVHG